MSTLTKKELQPKLYTFKDRKQARSKIIKEYTDKPLVCLTCGNSATNLEKQGLKVIHIGENGTLTPNKWFTQKEIKQYFPNHFDTTSGHLNMELMNKISTEYKKQLKTLPNKIYLPTGSGETLICLKLAFPQTKIIAVYNINKETQYHPEAPLNNLVKLLSEEIIDYSTLK